MRFIIIALLCISWIQPNVIVDMKYVQPVTSSKYQLIQHKYYSILYSDHHKQAYCSYYKLTRDMLKCNLDREDHFTCDTLVKGIRVKPTDYNKTGYDRGHLACQADMCFNHTAMNQSFYMSNMSPQVPGFNRGAWKKLEHQCRQWASEKGEVFIFTGGVLKPGLKKISKDSISVPDYFYKVVIHYDMKSGVYETVAFMMPNRDIDVYDLNDYIVSIDEVEQATGLDFLNKVPDTLEFEIEKWHKTGNWNINP